jgi:hypothetical protein
MAVGGLPAGGGAEQPGAAHGSGLQRPAAGATLGLAHRALPQRRHGTVSACRTRTRTGTGSGSATDVTHSTPAQFDCKRSRPEHDRRRLHLYGVPAGKYNLLERSDEMTKMPAFPGFRLILSERS